MTTSPQIEKSLPDDSSSGSSEDSSSSDDDLAVGMGSSISMEEATNGVVWAREGQCYVCGKTLGRVRGVHRHHCRNCGESVCNLHSSHRRLVPQIGTYVRMCDPCSSFVVAEPLEIEAKSHVSRLQAQISALTVDTKRLSELGQKQEIANAQVRTEIAKGKKAAETETKRLMTLIQGVKDRELKFSASVQRLSNDRDVLLSSRDAHFAEFQQKKSEFDTMIEDEIQPLMKCVKILEFAIESHNRELRKRIPNSKVWKFHCRHCAPLPDLSSSGTPSTESKTSSIPQNQSCGAKCVLM